MVGRSGSARELRPLLKHSSPVLVRLVLLVEAVISCLNFKQVTCSHNNHSHVKWSLLDRQSRLGLADIAGPGSFLRLLIISLALC